MLATLTTPLCLPACASLKEKRGRIKPLISAGCAMFGNDYAFLQSTLQYVTKRLREAMK